METDITAHVTTAAVIVYAIEALKRWPAFRWITMDSTVLTRVLSALLAALAALGIGWTYSSAEGTLLITGLTLQGVATAGWEWLKQFCVQQLLYDGVVQKAGGVN